MKCLTLPFCCLFKAKFALWSYLFFWSRESRAQGWWRQQSKGSGGRARVRYCKCFGWHLGFGHTSNTQPTKKAWLWYTRAQKLWDSALSLALNCTEEVAKLVQLKSSCSSSRLPISSKALKRVSSKAFQTGLLTRHRFGWLAGLSGIQEDLDTARGLASENCTPKWSSICQTIRSKLVGAQRK